MLKRLLFASFIGIAALGAGAEYMNVEFTYADDKYGTWGKAKNEVYDIAMAINNPAFAGKKITSVSALISTVNGIEDISLWLSSELKLENKKNVPDIASMSVNRENVNLTPELQAVKISATLPEPYVITGAPVYVGYTLNVTDNEMPGADEPVIISGTTNPEGFYAHCSKTVIKWKSMVESTEANACIYVTIEGELDPYCLGIVSLPEIYSLKGNGFSVPATVCNAGSEVINEIEYSYEVAGTTKNGKVMLDTPVLPDVMGTQEILLPFEGIDVPGPYDMNVTIEKLNGQPNAAIAPTGVCMLNIMPFMPEKRPLVEDFSGTPYGYSPRAYIALQMLDEEFGDGVVCASYHFTDPMNVTAEAPLEINGFPSGTIDRNGICDTYYGTFNRKHDFGIRDNILELKEQIPVGEISVTADWNEEKTDIDVSSEARFVRGYDDVYYEIGYLLLANGLHGEESDWVQSNNLAGDKDYAGTYLEVVTTWPNEVPDLIFNDIVVDVDAYMGIEGSLPFKIEMDKAYQNTFRFTEAGSNELIQDPENVYVVAFIIDKFTGRMINARKVRVGDDSGMQSVCGVAADVVETTYYDLTGYPVSNPAGGIFIKVMKMSDGSTVATRVAVR